MDIAEYCRAIETHLCRKNDGHLIRVVGPAFELVAGWAERGIPIKVAYGGIDRYFERYYAKGPRRRPVRVEFCDADVLDVFDEWRRATGVAAVAPVSSPLEDAEPPRHGSSLPAHLERVLRRLTSARATGTLDADFDSLLDRVALELDAARSAARGVRGAARQAMVERLAAIDRELLAAARATLDADALASMTRESDDELSGFRAAMSGEAYERARGAVIDRMVRERLGLPTIAFA